MATRTKGLIIAAFVVAWASVPGARAAQRIVSLVPALTEMIFAIGAGSQVVAVSSFDEFPPEVKTLPRVGALLDPDLERILALRADLVLTYEPQASLRHQLNAAGIRTFRFEHGGINALFETMRQLGRETGHSDDASHAIDAVRRQLDIVRAKVRGRPRPRVLLVFGREPLTLRRLFVSGGTGFLHDILETAGGTNVFADVPRLSVQPSRETILARAPDVIVELHAPPTMSMEHDRREQAVWSALASMPAVRHGRIHLLYGSHLVVPGPRVGLAAEAIARALHPETFR